MKAAIAGPRKTIGDGPGCTAVEHYPDRTVTNDPRWTEEQTALRRELRDSPR
jgi:hypothetical protein